MAAPQNYFGAYDEDLAAKVNNNDWIESGEFFIPEFTYGTDYVLQHHPDCTEFPVMFGCNRSINDLVTVGDGKYLIKTESYRRNQDHLATFEHLMGHQSLYGRYGNSIFTAVESFLGHFQIVSISGKVITLKCGLEIGDFSELNDPRNVLVWSGVDFDLTDPLAEATTVSQGGSIQPGDYIIFVNNVFWNGDLESPRSRIECRVTKCNFSGLPQTGLAISDTFTLTVDQECSNGDQAFDPSDDESVPYIVITGKRFQRENWVDLGDSHPMPYKFKTIELTPAEIPEDGGIVLKDNHGADCACQFPLRRNLAFNFAGTFILEQDKGAGYVDITPLIESLLNGYEHYERFEIVGAFPSNITTLYVKAHGSDTRDFTVETVKLRITYCYESDEADAIVGGERQCGQILVDRNKWIDDGTGAWVPTDVDDETDFHVTCPHWKSLTEDQTANFNFRCNQYTCPFFTYHNPRVVDGYYWQQCTSGMNLAVVQVGDPGSSDVMAFQYAQINTPGLLWQLTPSFMLHSNFETAFTRKTEYFSWYYTYVDPDDYFFDLDVHDIETGDVIGQDEHIKRVDGAFENISDFNAIPDMDWAENRFPDDHKGILMRRMDTSFRPLTQFSEVYDSDVDLCHQQDMERLTRKIAPVYENTDAFGNDVSFTVTNLAGIWGENALIRSRAFARYIAGVKVADDSIQGLSSDIVMQIFPAAQTLYGIANIRAQITIKGV